MTAADTTDRFCTFYLDGRYFGVGVDVVQEVIRYQHLTRVPLAPREIRGLINLRGQIVTAFDLRRRLGLPDRPAGQNPMNVVVRSADGAVSLLVDEIADILTVPADAHEPPPDALRGPARELIRGAVKLDDQLLLLLNTDQVLTITH